jgi:hypothetical protein
MSCRQVGRPYFEDALSRQFTRLRKASVSLLTYIDTHYDLLSLVLDSQALDEVMQLI